MRASKHLILLAAAVALVGLLITGAIAGYAGRAGHGALAPGLDAARAEALAAAARHIPARGADAAEPLEAFCRSEPENAVGHYLLAAAHARRDGWGAATDALREGNQAPRAVIYAHPLPFERDDAALAVLRSLREEFADAALSRPGAEAGRALAEGRVMASRVARAEPLSLATLEAGIALRSAVAHATYNLAQKAGEDWRTDAARAEEKADAAFLKEIRAERERLFGEGGPLHPGTLREKYALTDADAAALAGGSPPEDAAPATRERIAQEWCAAERAAAERLLARMPQ